MFEVILNIVVFLFVLGLVIMIHEFGHFIMAKRANILCHEFSLGMGPILWSKKKGETLYTVRAIPFGGYVMMAGEEVNDELIGAGDKVRIVTNEFGIVEKIVLDVDDSRYEECEVVTVESVDLKGENNEPLYLNDRTVKRNAFYVFSKRELQISPIERSFESKTKLERFLAIFAGPFMNFVLAFFLFIIIGLMIGFPNYDNSLIGTISEDMPAYDELYEGDEIVSINGVPVSDWDDIKNELDNNVTDRLISFVVIRDEEELTILVTPVIYFYSVGFHSDPEVVNILKLGEMTKDTNAEKAGFLEGDIITHVDGAEVSTWYSLVEKINANEFGAEMEFTVLRGTESIDIKVTPYNEDLVTSQGIEMVESRVGIGPTVNFSLVKSFGAGFTGVQNSAMMIFTTLDLLFSNEQVGVDDLAGPAGIYQITSKALSNGFISLLSWTALLSVNLGVINLLPIPALDGGRLVFLGYEVITTKKPNKKIENTIHYAMYVMLMGLFVYITFNDILRLMNIK